MAKPKKPKQDPDPAIPKVVQLKLQAQYDHMQTPESKRAAKALFRATPQEPGAAAVEGAKKKTPEQLEAEAKIRQAFAARQARAVEATQAVWARGRRTIGFEGLSAEDQLAEIVRLEAEPVPKQPIGKAVRVVKDIPSYVGMGGWGDGPSWLRAGAQIWLVSSEDGLCDWVSGPKPPVAGEHRAGNGFFPIGFLSHCEDLL